MKYVDCRFETRPQIEVKVTEYVAVFRWPLKNVQTSSDFYEPATAQSAKDKCLSSCEIVKIQKLVALAEQKTSTFIMCRTKMDELSRP